MINRLIRNAFRFLEKQFQTLTLFNVRIILYTGGAYGIYALHHFFPYLTTLYTFKNATYLLLIQGILLVLHKRKYIIQYLPLSFRQISAYFEVTNFFLSIVLFTGVYIFTIQGVGLSDLTGFLILFTLGSVYNFIYKNEAVGLCIKERIDILGVLFALGVNMGIFLFLSDFLVRNSLQSISVIAISITLLSFNLTLLLVFTDTFERIQKWYIVTVAELSRKTAKRWKVMEAIILTVIGVGILLSGGYFGYGYYRENARMEAVIPKEVTIALPDTPLLDDFLPLLHEEDIALVETGSVLPGNEPMIGTSDPFPPIIKKQKTIGDLYTFNRYIGVGDTGKDVIELQKILKTSGFYLGTITGTFDSKTGDALSRFIQTKTGNKTPYTQLGPKALTIWNTLTIEN